MPPTVAEVSEEEVSVGEATSPVEASSVGRTSLVGVLAADPISAAFAGEGPHFAGSMGGPRFAGGEWHRGARVWNGGPGAWHAGNWHGHDHFAHDHFHDHFHNRFVAVGIGGWWPGYYDYGYGYGGCGWLYRRAVITGSPYWWDRYNSCTYYY